MGDDEDENEQMKREEEEDDEMIKNEISKRKKKRKRENFGDQERDVKKQKSFRDEEFYLPLVKEDNYDERGFPFSPFFISI